MTSISATVDLAHVQAQRASTWGRWFVLIIIAGLVGLLGRVIALKLMPDQRLIPALGSYTSTKTEMSRRGDLVDRRGRVIATSSVGYRLFIDPDMVSDKETIA